MAANKFYDVIPGGPAPGMNPGCIGPYIIFDPEGPCLYAWDSRTHVWEKMCITGLCGQTACAADADLAAMNLIYCSGETACEGSVQALVAFILEHLALNADPGVATDVTVTPTVDAVTGNTTYAIKVDVRYADGLAVNANNQLVVVPEPGTGVTVGPEGVGFDGCAVVEDDATLLSAATAAVTEFLATTRDATGACRFTRLNFLEILRKLISAGTNITFTTGADGQLVINSGDTQLAILPGTNITFSTGPNGETVISAAGGGGAPVCPPAEAGMITWDNPTDCATSAELATCNADGDPVRKRLEYPGHDIIGASFVLTAPVVMRFHAGGTNPDDVFTSPWVTMEIENPNPCRSMLVNLEYVLRIVFRGLYGNGHSYPAIAKLQASVNNGPAQDIMNPEGRAWAHTNPNEALTQFSDESMHSQNTAISVPPASTSNIRVRAVISSVGDWDQHRATAYHVAVAYAGIRVISGITY